MQVVDGYRRTGLTLKEGKRDEYGMEEIEGMWSSPEKSPVAENGFDSRHEDSSGSDGMSIDEGTRAHTTKKAQVQGADISLCDFQGMPLLLRIISMG